MHLPCGKDKDEPKLKYRVKIAERDAQRAMENEAAQRAIDIEADYISDNGWGDE